MPDLVAAETSTTDAAIDLARETLYRFLAALVSDPRGPAWEALVLDSHSQAVTRLAADLLHDAFAGAPAALGFGELPIEDLDMRPVLQELARPLDELRDEYVRTFGLVFNRECPPYETEYQRNEDTFFRAQQMADIGGFYRAFGLQPGADRGERPDHIATELEFMSLLLHKQRTAFGRSEEDIALAAEHCEVCRQAQADFLREHLGWWTPAFAHAVRRKAEQGICFATAGLLAAFLPVERTVLGVSPPQPGVQPASDEEIDDCESCGYSEPSVYQIDPRGAEAVR